MRGCLARGRRPVVPAAVVAQIWRGGPQAQASRLLRGCRIEALDDGLARSVGVACARSRTSDVVDAAVVVGAVRRDDVCVVSDPADLRRVADGLARSLRLHVV